jgi:hypothetical protein
VGNNVNIQLLGHHACGRSPERAHHMVVLLAIIAVYA